MSLRLCISEAEKGESEEDKMEMETIEENRLYALLFGGRVFTENELNKSLSSFFSGAGQRPPGPWDESTQMVALEMSFPPFFSAGFLCPHHISTF